MGQRAEQQNIILEFDNPNAFRKKYEFATRNAMLRLCAAIKDNIEQEATLPMLVLPQ